MGILRRVGCVGGTSVVCFWGKEVLFMNTYVTSAATRRLREGKKLTQQALADKIGVSCKAVSKWETGDSLR